MAERHIVLVEAWYTQFGHIQFNRAFLSVIEQAFPEARVSFACPATYRRDMETAGGVRLNVSHWIETRAWSHPGHTPSEFVRRTVWLREMLRRLRREGSPATEIIVLGASGPIILALSAARLLSFEWSCRAATILHGGDEIVRGWQPRNPLRRLFTFQTAVRLLPWLRVRAIAAEDFICSGLQKLFPRQAESFRCIPMAFDEIEAADPVRSVSPGPALRVAFVGQATPHKGFREFLQLATLARNAGGSTGEFRAAGAVRADTRDLDQSALQRRAGETPIDRSDLVEELRSADLVFTWQSDYYALSSSGVLLDCIGHGVPLIGRRSVAIAELEQRYGPCGLFENDVEVLFEALRSLATSGDRNRRLAEWKHNLAKARADRSARALAAAARQVVES